MTNKHNLAELEGRAAQLTLEVRRLRLGGLRFREALVELGWVEAAVADLVRLLRVSW